MKVIEPCKDSQLKIMLQIERLSNGSFVSMANINYQNLATLILEQIPKIMGVQPNPWPTNYLTGKVMPGWMVTELAQLLERELND